MDARTHVFPTSRKKAPVKKVYSAPHCIWAGQATTCLYVQNASSHTSARPFFFVVVVIHLGGLTTTSNTCNATFRLPVHHKHLSTMGIKILVCSQSIVTITADRSWPLQPRVTRKATIGKSQVTRLQEQKSPFFTSQSWPSQSWPIVATTAARKIWCYVQTLVHLKHVTSDWLQEQKSPFFTN